MAEIHRMPTRPGCDPAWFVKVAKEDGAPLDLIRDLVRQTFPGISEEGIEAAFDAAAEMLGAEAAAITALAHALGVMQAQRRAGAA